MIYDLFTRQKPDVKKKLGEKLNNFYPDLPETIAYDRESFRAILANTDENDTPFTHEKLHHIRLPLTSNDLMYISMSLMTEIQNSPAFYDTRKPNPYQSIAAE